MRVLLLDFDEKTETCHETSALAHHLAEHSGHDAVHTLCSRSSELEHTLKKASLSVQSARVFSDLHLSIYLVNRLLEQKPFTVVHALGLRAARVLLLAKRLRPQLYKECRVVLTIRDEPGLLPQPWILPLKGRKGWCAGADVVCCHTPQLMAFVCAQGVDASVVHHIELGLDTPGAPHAGATPHISHNQADGRCVFLVVEPLQAGGAITTVLEAMAALRTVETVTHSTMPAWEVRIVGTGEGFAALLEQAQTLGVEARLALLGKQSIASQMALCNVFLTLSHTHGVRRRCLDALNLGVPVIDTCNEFADAPASDMDKTTSVSVHNGVLHVRALQGEALAQAMDMCLDAAQRARWAQEAQAYAGTCSRALACERTVAAYAKAE